MCCLGKVVNCSQTYILWKSMTNRLIRILYFSFTKFYLSVWAVYYVEDDFELFSADKSEILSLIWLLFNYWLFKRKSAHSKSWTLNNLSVSFFTAQLFPFLSHQTDNYNPILVEMVKRCFSACCCPVVITVGVNACPCFRIGSWRLHPAHHI